jgi:hypothetical protein
MREIIPFTGIAVFQIDEEMENARTRPDHVGKAPVSWRLVTGRIVRERSTVARGLLMVAAPT